jgi:hypothetical protein
LKYHIGSRLEHVPIPVQSGVETGENRPTTAKEAGTEITLRFWEQFLELVCFHFSKKQTETYFSLEQGRLQI